MSFPYTKKRKINYLRLHTFFFVNEDLISLKIGGAAKAGAFD